MVNKEINRELRVNVNFDEREISNMERERVYKKLYLGEIMKKEKPQFGHNNLVLAPVGSGKSFLIEKLLIPKNYVGTVLYLTSNTALKDSLCPNDNKLRKEFAENGQSINFFTTENKKRYGDSAYNVHLMTYHEFGKRIESPNEVFTKNKYLIFCDEVHSLPIFTQYDGGGVLNTALRWLFQKHDDKTIYYFTATREGLDNLERRIPGYLDNIKEFDYINHPEIRKYEAKSTYYVSNVHQLRVHLKAKVDYIKRHGCKGLAFTRLISGQKILADIAESEGFTPIILWSVNNEDLKMSDEQLRVRKYLLSTGNIPEPYNLLIINGAMQEGWNLYDEKVEFAILDTMNETEKVQALGRIRKDVDFIVLKTNDADYRVHQVILEDKYINKILMAEDKKDLVEDLNIKNDRNNIMKWPTIKKIIINSGYEVEDKIEVINGSRRRISIITNVPFSEDL